MRKIIALALAVFAGGIAQANAQATSTINGLPLASFPLTCSEVQAVWQNGRTLKAPVCQAAGIYQGTVAPTGAFQYQLWMDTSASPAVLKQYDGSQWVSLATVDSAAHAWKALTTALPGGKSVADPGTGVWEALLPVQTITGASKTFGTADLQKETRWSNSGSAMAGTFPASGTTGLANGARITISNGDASAAITITAGSGTTIAGNSTDVVDAGRGITYVYDAANTAWRRAFNTASAAVFSSTGSLTPGNVPSIVSAYGKVQDSGLAVANIATAAGALTSNGIALGGGGKALSTTAAPTTGQILIGQASGAPVLATLSGDATMSAAGAVTVSKIGGTTPGGSCSTGQFVNSVSSSAVPSCAGPTLQTIDVLTSGSGATYNVAAGARQLIVEIKGGGGGGGPSGTSGFVAAGGGGTSTFNSINAQGGFGATTAGAGAPGSGGYQGTGTATYRIPGAPGGMGGMVIWSSTNFLLTGGSGGGKGGGAGRADTAAGNNGFAAQANSGGGGGGAQSANATQSSLTTSVMGHGGGEGETAILVINSPASSYTYTVGAGGAGGQSSLFNGGNGGSGIIIVHTYF